MILDMDRGRLGFAVDQEFLGWTHTGLKSHGPLFPMVSTVWGQCEVKLRYLGGLTSISLQMVEITRHKYSGCQATTWQDSQYGDQLSEQHKSDYR